MNGDVNEKKVRAARLAVRMIPAAVGIICIAQLLAIGLSTSRLFDVARSQGVETLWDLWKISQAYDAGHSTFARLEVRVIQHFEWIYFSLERLLLVSVFGLSLRPLLRDFHRLAQSGQHRSEG